MGKLLSVIIPSYNMEGYLPKCLNSLRVGDAELLQLLEVIVVNDGSQDRTSEIAHEFERQLSGVVRVLEKSNGNYGSCVNVGLKAAVGEYVRVLDADDWVRTDDFQDFLAFLRECSSAPSLNADRVATVPSPNVDRVVTASSPSHLPDVVVAAYDVVDQNDRVTSAHRFDFLPLRRLLNLADVTGFDHSYFQNHSVTYRRALFDGDWYRQMEGCSYTDMQWYMLPLARAKTMTVFPQSVVCYLVGREGQTVADTTRLQGTGTLCRVLKSILCELDATHSGGFAAWLPITRELLRQQLRWLYGATLFAPYGNPALLDLARFDAELQTLAPELHREVGDFRRRLFHFRYVREWRRTATNASLKFRLFNWVYKVVEQCI